MNILHISDAHVQKSAEQDITCIVKKLIDDVKSVQKEQNLSIDFICFTGDLIQRGDMALEGECEWNLAQKWLVTPLLEALSLPADHFIFVPGNHEVNIKEINPALENGLSVSSLDKIDEYLKNFDNSYRKRLEYLYTLLNEWQKDAYFSMLGYAMVKKCGKETVGFVCLDSAWRSSGKGTIEKGHLYVGTRQIKELYQKIESADIKICLMHHPIDWLVDEESLQVEKELSNFDIVLRGHVHESDDKNIIRQNVSTLYCTAGKLHPIDMIGGRPIDGYNGYTILSVDRNEDRCALFMRTYYAMNREEFGPAENIAPAGKREYTFARGDKKRLNVLRVREGLTRYYNGISEKFALIKDVDSDAPNNTAQALIDPVLSETSDYMKDGKKKGRKVEIQEIVESMDNYLLIGKRESGKTSILQHIAIDCLNAYETQKALPVYIDMRKLPSGADKLERTAMYFVQESIIDTYKISKEDIRSILNEENVVFLIDNVNSKNPDHTILLKAFLEKYSGKRFIASVEEDFFGTLDVKELPEYFDSFNKVYVNYLGKAEIREFVSKWVGGDADGVGELVEQIDHYCNQVNFAKTPFNISILMVLWDQDNSYIPVNEGIVMQNYLEIVLEKISTKESSRKTYGYNIKEDFLSYLAHEMYEVDCYYFTYEDFMAKTVEYHKRKFYSIPDSRFDTLFFEKNILCNIGGLVSFSHTSFLEYFLAVYALKNDDFLHEIMQKGKRVNFQNEICFYSGLNQNCEFLLDDLSDTILQHIIDNLDILEGLNYLELMAEFKQDKDEFLAEIGKHRMSQAELDKMSDEVHSKKEKKPQEIRKKAVKRTEIIDAETGTLEDTAEDFFALLRMYGSIIKNSELLDGEVKIKHLEYYMYGMNLLYAFMVRLFTEMKERFPFDKLDDSEKEKLNISNDTEFEKAKQEVLETVQLIFPIVVQDLIRDNVGTPKLDQTILELIKQKKDKPFEKFMLVFLRCDLRLGDLKHDIMLYVKNEDSKSILKLILQKLVIYYQMRYFGFDLKTDNDLVDLVNETMIKINSDQNKAVVKGFKGKFKTQVKKDLDNLRL